MKCPLACIGDYDQDNIRENEAFDCLEEECAWFHPITQSCEVSRIASNLSSITHELDQIAKELTLVRER